MSSTSFLKKIKNGLVSILFGVFMAFIIGEIVVRVFGIETVYKLEYYKSVVPRYKPGITFTNQKEREQEIEINELGFHDKSRDKKSTNYRLLMLGDSFLEGKQVPVDSLFSAHLERRLRNKGCTNVEVLNAGMAGMGTAAEYVIWREYIHPEVDYDEVILQIYMGNDLKNNSRALSAPVANKSIFCDSTGAISIEDRPEGFMKRILKFLRDYSALVNLVYSRAALLKRGETDEDKLTKETGKEPAARKEPVIKRPKAWQNTVDGTLALIENWHKELVQLKKPFRVFVINKSQPWAVHSYDRQFMEQLKLMGERDGFPVEITEFGSNPVVHFSWDQSTVGHFNFAGHRESGKQLYRLMYPLVKEHCKSAGMASK